MLPCLSPHTGFPRINFKSLMKNKNILPALVPIMFGFFVMGFVDIVGISTSYVKADFAPQLPEHWFGFLPSVVLVWFLVLSIPTSLLMNSIGRKNTVLLSVAITFAGMAVPFINYNLYTCLAGFAFLGIGNAVLQVSLMPLLTNVVSAQKLASAATGGQAVKAVSSFAGPFIAFFAASELGSWQYIFPIFGGFTAAFGLWLYAAEIDREKPSQTASLGGTFALLSDGKILAMFFGIIAVVGVDMGMNMGSPMLLMERMGLDPSLQSSVAEVALVPSVYFACRTVGAFAGTAMLAKMNPRTYFKIHIIFSLAATLAMFFVEAKIILLALLGCVGYGISSIFSVIFSEALNLKSDKENEISGLMITAIFGGAVLPPVMTFASKTLSSQNGALSVLAAAMIYLIICAFAPETKKAKI